MTSSLPVQRLTDDALWARVARQARCADGGLDPDQWYPVSIEPARARHEAAAAIDSDLEFPVSYARTRVAAGCDLCPSAALQSTSYSSEIAVVRAWRSTK